MTLYLITYIKIPAFQAEAIYASISITAPPLGIICGGIILDKIGGYENPNVPKLLLITSIIVI